MIIFVTLALLAFLITVFVLFILALIAVMNNYDTECDQPLKYYLMVSVVWSWSQSRVSEAIVRPAWGLTTRVLCNVALTVPAWCIIGWGYYMVSHIRTCPKTNPDLFYPTRSYIFAQMGFAVMALMITMFG